MTDASFVWPYDEISQSHLHVLHRVLISPLMGWSIAHFRLFVSDGSHRIANRAGLMSDFVQP